VDEGVSPGFRQLTETIANIGNRMSDNGLDVTRGWAEDTNQAPPTRIQLLEHHVGQILDLLGYDRQHNEHFLRTPIRAAQVLETFHANSSMAEAIELLGVQFSEEHNSLVQVGPISYVSMCAHHMLPVTGKAWVGYIPQEKVCGLSKLARVTHHFARQFSVQESVTTRIADALEAALDPMGVMVVVKAAHGCMTLRGVQEPHAETVTSAVRGVFLREDSARNEFMSSIMLP